MPRRLAQTSASATRPASAALAPRAWKTPATRPRRSSALTRTLAAFGGAGVAGIGVSVVMSADLSGLTGRIFMIVGRWRYPSRAHDPRSWGGTATERAHRVRKTLTTAVWPPRTVS